MGTPIKHMTCEEIWYRYEQGISITNLAELNRCTRSIISRILNGEDYVWSGLNVTRPRHIVVVNVEEGHIYPSISAAEKAEGITKGVLGNRVRLYGKDTDYGQKVIFRGAEYHFYRKEQ